MGDISSVLYLNEMTYFNKTLPGSESKGQQTENPLMTGFPKSQCLIWKMKIIITVPEESAFMPCSNDFTRAGNSDCAY